MPDERWLRPAELGHGSGCTNPWQTYGTNAKERRCHGDQHLQGWGKPKLTPLAAPRGRRPEMHRKEPEGKFIQSKLVGSSTQILPSQRPAAGGL